MRLLRGLAALVALVLAQPASAQVPHCALPAPTVIEQSGDAHAVDGRLLQVWDMADAPIWWSNAEPEGYGAFRARVAAKAGNTDPAWLLSQNPSLNNKLVADAAAAWINPANCLDKLLLQTQDARLDTFVSPTEFLAAVLRSADGKRLRIYYFTVNQDGIGRATPVTDPVARDHATGWTVLAFAHNHNFHPGQPVLNAPLAPSVPDANFNANAAARFGMAEAWITNGLHTARLPASAFGRFEGATK